MGRPIPFALSSQAAIEPRQQASGRRLDCRYRLWHAVFMGTKREKAVVKKGPGAPTKAPGGLPKVLFVRAQQDLLEALDRLVDEEREKHPGRGITRSDIARELLYRAVAKGPKETP